MVTQLYHCYSKIFVPFWTLASVDMSKDTSREKISKKKTKSIDPNKDSEQSTKKRKRHHSEDEEPSQMKKKKKRKSANAVNESSQDASRSAKFVSSPQTSPFCIKRASFYLPVAPIAQEQPAQALCAEHLSPLIMTYYQPFHAYVLAYQNVCCQPQLDPKEHSTHRRPTHSTQIDESAATFSWLSADFLLFKPQKSDVLDGYINLQNESSLGILCWNFFNASIARSMLPAGWTWSPPGLDVARRSGKSRSKPQISGDDENVEGEDEEGGETQQEADPATFGDDDGQDHGHFRDESERRVSGLVTFAVTEIETSRTVDLEHSFISIGGTMLKPASESMENGEAAADDSQRTADSTQNFRSALSVSNLPASIEKLKYAKL